MRHHEYIVYDDIKNKLYTYVYYITAALSI